MTDFDVLVIGAGPAGSVAATLLARRGFHVGLVEKKTFPRRKICGACLSGFAVEGLRKTKLASALETAVPLSSFQLAAQGKSATISLSHGCVISRSTLDAALVREAVAAGARFIEETTAELGPVEEARIVMLTTRDRRREVRAKSVIVATGLGGASYRHDPELRPMVAERALIGAGAEFADQTQVVPAGRIVMATHSAGYVGFVRTECGTINVAAALDRRFVTSRGGVANATQEIARSAGWNGISLECHEWAGTPPLTRHPTMLASRRAFLVGDAAGYVEPFTGEGIGWAIASATEVVPFVAQAVEEWSDSLVDSWTRTYQKQIGRRQRFCRAIAISLRSPRLVGMAVRVLQPFPGAARPVLRHLAVS